MSNFPDPWQGGLDSTKELYRHTRVTEELLMPQLSDVNYAEILRLSRRLRLRADEPLWETFIRIGQQLEKTKPPRCGKCFRTDLEYSRLVDATCDDAFHTTAPHPAELADFLKSHQKQVANLLDEIERLQTEIARLSAPSRSPPHICSEAECPYNGQPSTVSCRCHDAHSRS